MNDSISQTFGSTLAGKVALVTGGTRGIGKGIAEALQPARARVVVTGVTDAEVADARGQGLDAVRLGVANTSEVEGFIYAQEKLNVLVNCAGVIRRGAEHDIDVFEQVVDVNLTGTMRCCTAALGLLEQHGGVIVNIASMLSFFGGGLVPGYSASKGGVAQLTKSLAIAYAPDKIAVAPGWISTPLTHVLQADKARNRAILERTPMRRWGEPADVAGAVVLGP